VDGKHWSERCRTRRYSRQFCWLLSAEVSASFPIGLSFHESHARGAEPPRAEQRGRPRGRGEAFAGYDPVSRIALARIMLDAVRELDADVIGAELQ